ncbi:hypothetical protein AU476_39565 [Cupriavidus sp. UYMSc13B]|nr:hypothetical protein AU476_39565 [Cupriavidus sp. UYMSc13B]
MAGRPGVTYEEVVQAAEAVKAHGKPPTIERVRSHLGGTGSPSDFARLLKEWQNQHQLAGEYDTRAKAHEAAAVASAERDAAMRAAIVAGGTITELKANLAKAEDGLTML